jgi:hypothetical protein
VDEKLQVILAAIVNLLSATRGPEPLSDEGFQICCQTVRNMIDEANKPAA